MNARSMKYNISKWAGHGYEGSDVSDESVNSHLKRMQRITVYRMSEDETVLYQFNVSYDRLGAKLPKRLRKIYPQA